MVSTLFAAACRDSCLQEEGILCVAGSVIQLTCCIRQMVGTALSYLTPEKEP